MSYEKGEIYFVREKSGRDGQRTPFIKIGLVRYKEKRDSYNRLAEHQTGNPRTLELVPEEIVVTDAVDMVEAQLHRVFAKYRVSGEWFEFPSDDLVAKAVLQAKELASEVAPLVPKLVEAEKLKNVKSNGLSKAPSLENKESANKLAIAKERIVNCNDLLKKINDLIAVAVDSGADVSEIASKTVKKYAPKFLVDEFMEAYPDLYEKYMTEVSSWEQRFLLKTKPLQEGGIGEEFESIISGIALVLDSKNAHEDLAALNEPKLALTHLKGLAEWDVQVQTAELKLSLGEFDELEGVCTWKRYSKVGLAFDSNLFAAENPDLAIKFVSLPVEKTYVNAKKSKI